MKNNLTPDLSSYLLFNRLLRFKKLKYKLFSLAFIATHIPLLTYIGYIFLSKQHHWTITELLIILLATLAGTVFVLWSINHLLKPLNYSAEALNRYLKDATIIPLPHHIDDEMGQLMRSVGYTLHSLDRRFKDLESVSSYDFLTDLHNRRSAKSKLNSNNFQSASTFIIMLDLDDFKSINDQYGHFAGDVVLKDVAQEIKSCMMTPDDWAARWGGDEFLLVLHGLKEDVIQQLKGMKQNIHHKQVIFEQQSVNYSISIGMAEYDSDKSIQQNLKQADQALFSAKNKGKNQLYQHSSDE
jgi:diguanylate cyclase (GGDEF)-like protein